MKHFLPALRMLLFMTLVTGVAYPLLVTGISQSIFSQQASGQLLERSGVIVGSTLLSQKFEGPNYFWGRPSAVGNNPLPSGGSNLSQINGDLKKTYEERKEKLKAAHPNMTVEPPQDLLFASGSGLDPHISPEATQYQLQRVATARGMDSAAVKKIVDEMTEGRQFGILGEPRVNVLALNLALDKAQNIDAAPVLAPEEKK